MLSYSDLTERDPSRRRLAGWLYNDTYYESTSAFRTAYSSLGFGKLGANVEGDWVRSGQQDREQQAAQ